MAAESVYTLVFLSLCFLLLRSVVYGIKWTFLCGYVEHISIKIYFIYRTQSEQWSNRLGGYIRPWTRMVCLSDLQLAYCLIDFLLKKMCIFFVLDCNVRIWMLILLFHFLGQFDLYILKVCLCMFNIFLFLQTV